MENFLTNEDLIAKIKLDKKELIDELYERNQNGIRKVAYDFYKRHFDTLNKLGCYDFEDILQIANIYFIESIEKYNTDKGVKYITFLMNYIQWKLTLEFFKHGKIKTSLRNEYNKSFVYDDVVDLTNDDNIGSNQNLPEGGWYVPVYIEDFDNKILVQEIIEKLNKQQDKDIIVDYYLNGLTDKEISAKYGFKNPKVARQSILRIVDKMKRKFKEENYE